jgi:nitroimidazol reductase NimA-like FMN-containing flavoprotein (pyridoxamine 5'-phosphate oxidase superfamily)
MRRREKEMADPEAILDVLARGEVLRLAMIAEDGSLPHPEMRAHSAFDRSTQSSMARPPK